ncbi:hypothetical protein [Mycolicibacter minnesotensis]
MIVDVAVRVAVGMSVLIGFNWAVGSKWPSSYYVLNDAVSAGISRTLTGFLMFRYGPLFLVAIGVGSHSRSRYFMMVALAAFWLSHVVHTGTRIYPYDRSGGLGARAWYSLQVVALLVAALVVLSAAYVIPLIDRYLPEWPALIEALVTGVFLAGAGAVAGRASARPSISFSEIEKGVRKWRSVVRNAAAAGCVDQMLALSLIIVEDLQRPFWFRRIESGLARIGLAETVGVGQSYPRSGVTDEDSIYAAIQPLVGLVPGTLDHRARHDIISARVERHNAGDEFMSAFWFVCSALERMFRSSTTIAPDGSPTVFISRSERVGDFVVLRGEAHQSVWSIAVSIEINGIGTRFVQCVELPRRSDGGRQEWETRLPLENGAFKVEIFYLGGVPSEVMYPG